MMEENIQNANTNLYAIIDQNEERKESLWAAWERDEGLENLLRLAIQEVEAQKVKHPELNISTSYQMGRFDGYTELLEQLFRARERDKAIRNNPGLRTEKSQLILDILYKMGETLHGDLADAVGSSYSSLTAEMKEMLLSGVVEATRSGRNTRYHLTYVGQKYYEHVFLKKD